MVVSGGYQNKRYDLDTEPVSTAAGDEHFVAVKHSMPWLLHACKGSGYRRGDLKRSRIIDDLRQKAVSALENNTGNDDPMLQIECNTPKGTPSVSSVIEANGFLALGPVSSVEETGPSVFLCEKSTCGNQRLI